MPRRRWVRVVLGLLVVLVAGGALAWRWQSVLIGRGAEWYLSRVAAQETAAGTVERRRAILTKLNQQLLMPAPPDALVPELFDLTTLMSSRVATGEIDLNWVAYLYTTYQRDMLQERPDGTPRRSLDQVRAELDKDVKFFSIQKRPEQNGIGVKDLLGTGDDVITLDEIESGKDIDLKTRGAK